ncbi:MAG: STAS-like domain-containing protein, partial [Stellaceae bacterium]
NHARSPIGGLLQVTNFGYRRRAIEFSVCDAGIGIPASLREGRKEIGSDQDALDKAIREGVTRDMQIGQGNGLYGTWRITQISDGSFEIHSGNASLVSYPNNLHVSSEGVPFIGTLVVALINYDRPLALEEALRFRGKPHDPVDIIEMKYEDNDEGCALFPLVKEAEGFGSRAAGLPIRQKLKNLIHFCSGKKLVVDFSGVPIVSSSFADEAFAKLFVELGPLAFMRSVEFRNVDLTIQGLIDKAIEQRTRTGL